VRLWIPAGVLSAATSWGLGMKTRAGAKIALYLGFFACIAVTIGALRWERGWSVFGEYPLTHPFNDLRVGKFGGLAGVLRE
jgi:hypothetical protein